MKACGFIFIFSVTDLRSAIFMFSSLDGYLAPPIPRTAVIILRERVNRQEHENSVEKSPWQPKPFVV